jgi:pyridoxine 4-dehydrogenase
MQGQISKEERLRIEAENRALLDRELTSGSCVFASRPFEAHIQFTNFCNMSCITCYAGANPPLEKMPPQILEKVNEQIAPSVSLVIPYVGSEPLIVMWDEARRMAERFSIELRITTNVQFLDEKKFYELKDITQNLFLSIDSHIPGLFDKIRPGGKVDKVFENFERTARLCREHRLECLANVVFLTENASTLPETVAYIADVGVPTVNVLQLIDVNGRSGLLDPLTHFSAEYIDWIKRKCVDVAREKHVCLLWNAGAHERYDFRAERIPPKPRKLWNEAWELRMRRLLPGFCRNVMNRVQITAAGTINPCSYGVDGELRLGRLSEQDFDSIWNGPTARDLRRAHYTGDLPSLCSTCRFTDRLPPERDLPFVDEVLARLERRRCDVDAALEIAGPAHMTRARSAPALRVEMPEQEIAAWALAFALGGEDQNVEVRKVEPALHSGVAEFAIPDDMWNLLATNRGYWWAIFALVQDDWRVLRTSELRCLVRHEPIARVEGSTLRYPDDHLPVADLGARKQQGWLDRDELPPRPALGERRRPFGVPHRRHRKRMTPPVRMPAVRTMTLGGNLELGRIGLGGLHVALIDDPADVAALIGSALELGANLIDTADTYGPALSELRIAAAMHPYPIELAIATKGGVVRDGDGPPRRDGRPAHLRGACEASLRRLRRETIDLYQLHAPDPNVPLEESVGALAELRTEGKIRHIGLSNVTADEIARALTVAPIVSVQNRLNLLERECEQHLRVCERHGLAFLAYQPLACGALARPDARLDPIAAAHGATRAQLALAWILHRSPVALPIPGTASVRHLRENLAAASIDLTEEELAALAGPVPLDLDGLLPRRAVDPVEGVGRHRADRAIAD